MYHLPLADDADLLALTSSAQYRWGSERLSWTIHEGFPLFLPVGLV